MARKKQTVKKRSKRSTPRARGTAKKGAANPERDNGKPPWLTVVGARQNNLRDITAEIPLERFVCVTGVSGSGKSSLVNDIIREALDRDLNGATKVHPGEHDSIDGVEHLDKVIDIDQSPIGRTPRSNPATYIKVFDEIRALYTKLPDAKVRGYKPGRFSFNVKTGPTGGGRCEACEGNGSNKIEMDFLADIWVPCPVCAGHRFSRETLQILFKGKSIRDVLEMDVQQALDHFESVPRIANMLRTLHDVGLDYLKLGQSSTTLSGGEAQRIKLARELVKKSTGRTLYILDEPTTGLHFADIKRLLGVLHGFVDAGNSVLVIEHNLDVVKTADWVIDLGPEGGAGGGRIIATGTPEQIAKAKQSFTGAALGDALEVRTSRRVGTVKTKRSRGPSKADGRVKDAITVVGARQHNLKNITVEVPRGKTTVCCGPSGSGKSSFAIDTVYAEGQRRYVESLSSYARQFLGRLQPPKVDHVYGLSPAISIEQKNTSKSPRSTVGTVTEIYDYMRVLWARIGKPHCPKCKIPIGTQSSDEIVERIMGFDDGSRLMLLAPVKPTGNETYRHMFERERANGYARVRVDGAVLSLDEPIEMDAKRDHTVELVVDRILVRANQRSRITDSVEQALTMGQGVMIAAPAEAEADAPRRLKPAARKGKRAAGGAKSDLRFSQHRSCEQCGRGFDELTPHHFSFNARMGWCQSCEGLGIQQGASPAAIITHPTSSIVGGAVDSWGKLDEASKLYALADALAQHIGFDARKPWNALTETHQLMFLQGCGDDWIEVPSDGRRGTKKTGDTAAGMQFKWRGFFPAIDRATRTSWQYRKRLENLVTEVPCEGCRGSRLQPEPGASRVCGRTIHEVCTMPLGDTLDWFEKLKLDARERRIAGELLHEITSRTRFLVEVGLDYITLHRTAATLSGGEAQRIQLASQIGSGLTGVLYVLDEPTIGLHPRDNGRLIRALHHLRDLGNTLLLVEHDREVIDSSDHVLDFGPGAGSFGGEVTAAAGPKLLRKKRGSLTGKYLSSREAIAVPSNPRPVSPPPRTDLVAHHADETSRPGRRKKTHGNLKWLTVRGAREHNLKEIDVSFPLSRLTCVTGVSGSGKSTLVNAILYRTLASRIHRARLVPGGHERIDGIEHIDKVINVDQSPIGSSPTSNPATYTGVFDAIRELFAKLPLSKIRGYAANRFSFNRPGGRCEACEGMGQQCIEMHFLPDVWVECESCGGTRYVPETLEVAYRGKNIADVLGMRVSEAVELLENVPKIQRMLKTLDDVGLGYVQLGQSAPTLSGGEAQRVKLAAELGRPSTGKTLYVLDEPTTGLHFDDLRKLLKVLHRLVDLGNTVICIEHNLDVIKTADWIIDLGPEAGWAGGEIVAEGTPHQVAETRGSHTGAALKPMLEAAPVEHREVFNAAKQVALERAAALRIELGDEVRMPWETDGRAWHTVDHVDRQGKRVGWDAATLVWLVEAIESLGGFAQTDWNNRSRIEITAPRAKQWFCHILTGGRDLLEATLRVKRGTFSTAALQARLGVKTLDERTDLPIYGQWKRVRVKAHQGGWEQVRLHLRDSVDVAKTKFKAFLKEAVASYMGQIERVEADPDKAAPWLSGGFDYHLSQKSIHRRHTIKWEPMVLMSLVGRFKSMQPDLDFSWATKTGGSFTRPGASKPAGKIVTNLGRGLRVELRVPRGEFTPTQVERLGEDVEIKPGAQHDRLVFWIRALAQIDSKQLLDVWRRTHGQAKQTRLRSA